MSLPALDEIRKHRDELLLAEIAALLHDLGKFTNLHIEAHSGGIRQWSNGNAYKALVDNPATLIQLSKTSAKLRLPRPLKEVRGATSPSAADFLTNNAKHFLQTTEILFLNERYSLAELIMLGTPGFATDPHRAQLLDGKSGWLAAVLGVCHNEAHHDKQDPAGGEQNWPDVLISTAFGFEQQRVVTGDQPESLDNRLLKLPFPPEREALLAQLAFGLGDTRRPINEITLADWAWTVCSLFKTAVAEAVTTGKQREIRGWSSWSDKIINHDLRWRVLRVNFDVLDLYSHAIKIADLLGYKKAIDDACGRVKHLLEDEYPIGNEVYRDTTGIYFTYPDLSLDDDLRKEIRKQVEGVSPELAPRIAVGPDPGLNGRQLRRLLADEHNRAQEELLSPFVPANLSSCWQQGWENLPEGAWEVCPVCRLRPKREDEEVCEECQKRRESRIRGWLTDPKTTIWLDELADENGRIALIVGKFGLDDWLSGDLVQTMLVKCDPTNRVFVPKNPSPARLRRVWETCQHFWEDTVSAIFRDCLSDRTRWELLLRRPASVAELPEGKVCDGKLNGEPISVLRIDHELLTISYIPPKAPPRSGTLRISWEGRRPKEPAELDIAGAREADGNLERFQKYGPTLTLLTSPDRFMALVPASDAVSLAEKVRDKYSHEFGKVQNRLPIFLGLIFFPRKIPLFAVMDTARRMLDQVDLAKEENWCVTGVQGDCVSFKNGYSWCVPQKMGDGITDIWYPYFFVEGDASGCPRGFSLAETKTSELVNQKYKDRRLVHVSELMKVPQAIVTPSRFAYKFLEHSAQRCEFDCKRDVMFLDELPRLVSMWDGKNGIRQTPQMTDTKLRSVAALLKEKEGWEHKSPVFRQLAQTTLKVAGLWNTKGGAVTPDDVVSRRFENCLELYLHILKQRVKEEEND